MSVTKPNPLQTVPARRLCPVCGAASYSRDGTHPQCLVARADEISREDRKAKGLEIKKAKVKKSWAKTCPQCKRETPARRMVCDCGHHFPGMPKNQFAR